MIGSLARIGPNHLLTNDLIAMQNILAVRLKYTRSAWYDSLRLDPHRSNLVTERNSQKHSRLRHQLSTGYGGKDIESMENAIDTRLKEWIYLIDRAWVSGPWETRKFDIGRSIQFLMTDIISHLSFGEPLGFVQHQKDMHDFFRTLETRLRIVEQFSVLTEFNTLLVKLSSIKWLKRKLIPSATDHHGVGRILRVSSRPSRSLMDKRFAGSDSIATALSATLLNIIINPSVCASLQAEIDTAVARGVLTDIVQNDEVNRELSYLQACIKEGLRIFPPITALRERVTPPEGDTINGYHVPGGMNIGLNM
ncbi:hypothetical protein ACLMJK_008477 [Lecanora helva]